MDNNPALEKFADTLEQVCISTIESGKMTKDLAICTKGGDAKKYVILYNLYIINL